MHTQPSLPFGDPVPLPGVPTTQFAQGFQNRNPVPARFIRSVVEEAGLNRFVYLQGVSGKRYVFSAIMPEQVGLYDRVVFAWAGADGAPVELSSSLEGRPTGWQESQTVFVHLLSEEEGSGDSVIADLSGVVQ